jgi:predicted DCC family thiol-disulfide oxidoreductase YuxK
MSGHLRRRGPRPPTHRGKRLTGPALPIVFFDGECNLCNGFVDYVIRHDPAGRHRFSPLQGETAREYAGELDIEDLSTVVLADEDGLYTQSDAVLRILVRLGGLQAFLGRAGRLCPRGVRDLVYRYVARHRYGWFGRRESCRVPTAEERARFLP